MKSNTKSSITLPSEELKLVVMSATLDSGALEKYLAPCTVLSSEGRMFPVSVDYLPRRTRPTAPRSAGP